MGCSEAKSESQLYWQRLDESIFRIMPFLEIDSPGNSEDNIDNCAPQDIAHPTKHPYHTARDVHTFNVHL